jgi:hypothetical protein
MKSDWLFLSAMAVYLAAAVVPGDARTSRIDEAQIHDAMSAAPPAIAAAATIAVHGKGSHVVVIRTGSNGWTCFPASQHREPGDDPEPKPACFDANGLAFMRAFAAGRPPDPAKPGYSYMLQGGSGWSNTDPMASKLARGRSDYIHIPPHFMVLSAKIANESGLPLHDADPETHKPFVMFGGTPFALMIIPVK